MELIPLGTKIDFLGKSKYAFVFSAILLIASIYVWISKGDSKYGIDFLGGHEIVVSINQETNSQEVEGLFAQAKMGDIVVQSFEVASKEYSIRLNADGSDAKIVKAKVEEILKGKFGNDVTIIKTDFVGPAIGEELKKDASVALALGLLIMLTYIAFRFEMSYAFGAVVALFHDVIICFGAYLFLGHTLNMSTVAAALTIIGYSVNDTIVIFDRVREEIQKRKSYKLSSLMNESVNVMLSRTLITSLLTFFSALALLFIGGGTISDLSLFLVVGIVSGSYSTIYIASPAVLLWDKYVSKKKA